MTTNELKSYIDRILGNNLRCILPSFWWKRLLGKMADRIEVAEKTAQSANRTAMLVATGISDELRYKQDQLYSGSNIKTINGESLLGSGNLEISGGGTADLTEINARVDLVSERVDDLQSEKQDSITDLAEIRANASKGATALQSVPSEYVTETELNQKGYATTTQLSNKQDIISDLSTIRANAAKGATALQSVPSEYVTETELSQKGYATTSQLNNKQDTISDLATIRSNASKGATALQSVPSEYVTETELNAKNFATVSQVNAKQDTISDLATIRSNAAKGATAIQKVKTINGEALDGEGDIAVLTKDLYDNLLEEMLINEEVYAAGVNDLNSILLETNDALNAEVTSREELSEDVQTLTNRVASNEEVTATSYNELNSRIESNYQHSEEAYATKTALADEVSAINAAIVDNEEVIAATLNDLLSRIEALTTRIE